MDKTREVADEGVWSYEEMKRDVDGEAQTWILEEDGIAVP